MLLLLLITIFASLFREANTNFGVVLSTQSPSTSVMKCILQSGYKYAVIFAISTNDGISKSVTQTLLNIKNSNMEAQIIFVPCRGRNAAIEVKDFIFKIPKDYHDDVWLLANGASEDINCKWSQDNIQLNVVTMIEIATEFKKNDYPNIGFVANSQYWDNMFGGSSLFKDFPLFWHPEDPNNNPSFQDFKPFGDWKLPVEKLFSQRGAVCGDDYSLCSQS